MPVSGMEKPVQNSEGRSGFLHTRTGAAQFLKVSLPQLDRYRRKGHLPCVWLDSHPRFLGEDLIAFAKSKRKPSTGEME